MTVSPVRAYCFVAGFFWEGRLLICILPFRQPQQAGVEERGVGKGMKRPLGAGSDAHRKTSGQRRITTDLPLVAPARPPFFFFSQVKVSRTDLAILSTFSTAPRAGPVPGPFDARRAPISCVLRQGKVVVVMRL